MCYVVCIVLCGGSWLVLALCVLVVVDVDVVVVFVVVAVVVGYCCSCIVCVKLLVYCCVVFLVCFT